MPTIFCLYIGLYASFVGMEACHARLKPGQSSGGGWGAQAQTIVLASVCFISLLGFSLWIFAGYGVAAVLAAPAGIMMMAAILAAWRPELRSGFTLPFRQTLQACVLAVILSLVLALLSSVLFG